MRASRILDLSQSAARLSWRQGRLHIDRDDAPPVDIAARDLAVVTIAQRKVSLSSAVLDGLAQNNIPLIICDAKSQPSGMLVSFGDFHAPARRLAAQAAASRPVKKRLWQSVVRAKITAQADALQNIRGSDYGLRHHADAVRSGDPENREAQAARTYWPAFFDDPNFLRRRELPDQNRYLNFGYAILRASASRAIVAAGLHPGLGIFHHHRNNPTPLADDLMEPFRPLIDLQVADVLSQHGPDADLTPDIKSELYRVMNARLGTKGESRQVGDWLHHIASIVALNLEGEPRPLHYPAIV